MRKEKRTTKKTSKEGVFHEYYHFLWRRWIKIKKVIMRTPIIYLIIFSLIFAFFVGYYFFLSPENNPQGEEIIKFYTFIETKGADLECEQIFENYRDGYITMHVNIWKKDGNENKIYLDIYTGDKKLPEDSLELSTIEFQETDYSYKINYIVKDEKQNQYYFDLSELKNVDPNVTITIKIGEDFLPIDKEIVTLNKRFISFPKHNCNLKEDALIEFLFPSEWEITACKELDEPIITGSRRIFSKAKNPNEIDYFIELERKFGRIALNDTKIGILLTLVFSIIALIISVHSSRRR